MKLTLEFIVIFVLVAAGYDIWTLWQNGYSTTISFALLTVSKEFPIIPFLGGVLIGHVLWLNKAATMPPPPDKNGQP